LFRFDQLDQMKQLGLIPDSGDGLSADFGPGPRWDRVLLCPGLVKVQEAGAHDGQKTGQAANPKSQMGRTQQLGRHASVAHRPNALLKSCGRD
jgi:hypothetical protein